jgi:hypothetical protein
LNLDTRYHPLMYTAANFPYVFVQWFTKMSLLVQGCFAIKITSKTKLPVT